MLEFIAFYGLTFACGFGLGYICAYNPIEEKEPKKPRKKKDVGTPT